MYANQHLSYISKFPPTYPLPIHVQLTVFDTVQRDPNMSSRWKNVSTLCSTSSLQLNLTCSATDVFCFKQDMYTGTLFFDKKLTVRGTFKQW